MSLSADRSSQTVGSVSTVNFTGSVTTNSNYTANWSVFDENSQQVVASGSGANFSFTPGQDPATYVATLTATDTYGMSNSVSTSISVSDTAPLVSLSADQPSQIAGLVGTVNFTGNVTASSGYVANWTIVDLATNQLVSSGAGTSFSFTPGQNPDTYIATLTVTDAYGQTGSASTSVSVSEITPVVSLGVDQPSQTAGSVGNVNFTGNVTATLVTKPIGRSSSIRPRARSSLRDRVPASALRPAKTPTRILPR